MLERPDYALELSEQGKVQAAEGRDKTLSA